MPSKLRQIAAAEGAVELARNDYSPNNVFDVSKLPLVNGVDMGKPIDITERITELARNDYSANKPYDSSQI